MKLRLAALATAIVAGTAIAATTAYPDEIKTWREQRTERLTAPEGWLSLVGLHWLDKGTHSIGSAADNDIVLSIGPPKLGSVTLDGAIVTLALAEGVEASIGDTAARTAPLVADSSGSPTVVRIGQTSFSLIERSGRYGLRVRDPQAKSRSGFVGIDYFEIDPAWRFEARFEAHPAGRTIDIVNVLDMLEPTKNPGVVVFEKNGKQYRLEALDDTGDGHAHTFQADVAFGKGLLQAAVRLAVTAHLIVYDTQLLDYASVGLTAVGEVPLSTLKKIAESVSKSNK